MIPVSIFLLITNIFSISNESMSDVSKKFVEMGGRTNDEILKNFDEKIIEKVEKYSTLTTDEERDNLAKQISDDDYSRFKLFYLSRMTKTVNEFSPDFEQIDDTIMQKPIEIDNIENEILISEIAKVSEEIEILNTKNEKCCSDDHDEVVEEKSECCSNHTSSTSSTKSTSNKKSATSEKTEISEEKPTEVEESFLKQ